MTALDLCADHGGNFIDTSINYTDGASERAAMQTLADLRGSSERARTDLPGQFLRRPMLRGIMFGDASVRTRDAAWSAGESA